jgi:hypothetical protein
MNPIRTLKFVRLDGTVYAYPRAHLRWLVLVSEIEIEVGFSSEVIVLQTRLGGDLGPLFQRLAAGTPDEVREVDERHALDGCSVIRITSREHSPE